MSLQRSLAVLGVGAGAIILPGSSGAVDAVPLDGALPRVAITELRLQRMPTCQFAWSLGVHSTDGVRVALEANAVALPSNPLIQAGKTSGVVNAGASVTLTQTAHVFAWPPGPTTLEVTLKAGRQTSALSLIETKTIPIKLPPFPVAELGTPVVTDKTDGTRWVSAKVSVAGQGQVSLDRADVVLRLCTASRQAPTFVCLPDAGVMGSLVPADCPGGQKFASASGAIPKAATRLKVTALLRGSGKAFGEKVFPLPPPQ